MIMYVTIVINEKDYTLYPQGKFFNHMNTHKTNYPEGSGVKGKRKSLEEYVGVSKLK